MSPLAEQHGSGLCPAAVAELSGGTAPERDGGLRAFGGGAGDSAVVPEDERLLWPRLSPKAIH